MIISNNLTIIHMIGQPIQKALIIPSTRISFFIFCFTSPFIQNTAHTCGYPSLIVSN